MSDFIFNIRFPFFVTFINIKGFDISFDDGEGGFEFVGGIGDEDFLFVVGVFGRGDDFFG